MIKETIYAACSGGSKEDTKLSSNEALNMIVALMKAQHK